MDKIEHRAVIKFLTKEGNTPKQIHGRMSVIYGESSPSYKTVKFWSKQFKWGRNSLEDDPRSGRPNSVTTTENISKIEKLILEDRRIRIQQIVEVMNISSERVFTIIHEHLGMRKVSARWVPRMLTPFDKQRRVECSQQFLDACEGQEDEFIKRIVTGDETWIHHFDPESKQESMQWKHKDSPPPKKFRVQRSAGKIMATIFWDCEGILLIDYLPHKTTVTGTYYSTLLRKLQDSIKEKRPAKLKNKLLLLHDNAPVHKAFVVRDSLKQLGFEELNHPPYSPDLAPCDYFLFRNLKKRLRGQRFSDDEDLKWEVDSFFADQEKDFYFNGLYSQISKCKKCIELEGDYIEK